MDIQTIVLIILSILLGKIIINPVKIIKPEKVKIEYSVKKASDVKNDSAIAKEGGEGDSLPLLDSQRQAGTIDVLDYIVPTDTDRGQIKEGDK